MGELHAEIERLGRLLANREFYAADPAAFAKASRGLSAARGELSQSEEAWLCLEARRERLAGGSAALGGD
jgi:ABC transport system ATP-binding/permease protein